MAKRVVVIGTGFVGLPLAIILADTGYKVFAVDIDENIVKAINSNEMHINETLLQRLMEKPTVRENLISQHTPTTADVFIISVPTPLDKRKKLASLEGVKTATESILPYLRNGNLVVVESTVPPLTLRELIKPMIEGYGLKVDESILLAHCPERILPGEIFYELVHCDRVIGGISEQSSLKAKELYSSFVKGNIYLTDDVTAEFCKLMENTYRDVNVALANELAGVGDTLKIDIHKAIELANKHPRVNILKPGIGVGGHCIPIDPWFIKETDPENCSLIFTARKINDGMPRNIAAKVRKAVRSISEPNIVALGVTYKPNIYDMRESPALEIIRLLTEDGYHVKVYDPLTKEYPCGSILDVVGEADCLVVLVKHDIVMKELQEYSEEIKKAMRTPIILSF